MIWADITFDGRSHRYVFVRDTVTAVRNRNEVLEPCVRLFASAICPDFILMDDNASRQRSDRRSSHANLRLQSPPPDRWQGSMPG
ncbi:hypothetical protein TNCV_3474351 [Trichonephila clavipes]|nr:hypothetical protein TNCV_3474351 [Trichonephila clavipes]